MSRTSLKLAGAVLAIAVVPGVTLTACSEDDAKPVAAAPSAAPSMAVPSAAASLTQKAKQAAESSTKAAPSKDSKKFCAFLEKEQGRLKGLAQFNAVARLSIDLATYSGGAPDGKALQAAAASCPGPRDKVLRATGLESFSALG